jgi:hypothetical protein
MIPSVAQQLLAVRRTLAATVVPAIAPGESFALEQAGLILATIDRVLDVQASEYRYDVLEHRDATALSDALGALQGVAPTDAPVPEDPEELHAGTLDAKRRAEERFRALLDTERADDARALMGTAARRATQRELAAARMTGFPRAVGSIGEVLARQTAEPFPATPGEAAR